MAKSIEAAVKASVKEMTNIVGATNMSRDLNDVILRFAQASLYRNTTQHMELLRREIVHQMAIKHFPAAQAAGRRSALPILDALGGRSLVERGATWRGPALQSFKKFHRSNMAVLQADLFNDVGTVNAEVRVAFARAARDGQAKNVLIDQLVKADRAELRQIRKVRTGIRQATREVATAEATGNRTTIRVAKKELSRQKARLRNVTSFYARFETQVQGQARDVIRSEAQRAQFASFQSAGFVGDFTWISVNGSDSCPTCMDRHGETRSRAEWRGDAPGDGTTLCLESCMCQLIPAEFTETHDVPAGPVNPFT